MNRSTRYNIILLLITVLLCQVGISQSKTKVTARADRNQILIGEPIRVELEVDVPENEPIRFFQIDTIPHFEFLGREKIDTSNTGSGTVLKQIIHVTSFDSGHWVIPPLPLIDSIATDSIPVDVGFAPFDPQQPYNDIKDIIAVDPKKEKEDYRWWYIGAGGLVLLVLLYFLLRKKKKPLVQVVVAPVDPYKEAMDGLDSLEKNKQGPKAYYTSLVDIFRVYVEKRKGIHSLQHTSDDLVTQLKALLLPAKQFEQLETGLRLSDFVKFAKYVPSAEDDKNFLSIMRETIKMIEELK